MADNGTFYSNKPLTMKRARAQQRALYASQRRGEIFHGGSYSIVKHNGQPHMILKGEGFIGDFLSKTKNTIAKVAGKTVGKVAGTVINRATAVSKGLRNNYPPSSRDTIAKYGNGVVQSLMLRREPIQSFINTALNFITMGKWKQAKDELNYDKLYHLSLVAQLQMPNGTTAQVLMEKNEVINISSNYSANSKVEYMQVPVSCCITLKEFLDKAQTAYGDMYFFYDAFKANCQMFLQGLLDANGLSTPQTTAFIMQPIDALLRKLPKYTSPFANTLTNIAGLANVAIQGEGKDVVMKPKDYFEEHKKIVALLTDVSNKLEKEAKEQASEAKGMKRKLEGKSTMMVGGVKLVGCMCDATGSGQSEYSKRHIEKIKAFSQLPQEEQQRISAEAEARRATLVNPMVERNKRVAEYNAEMRRRADSPFAPVVEGLTKVADTAVGFLEKAPGIGKVASEAYKAFAPPGSKFYGNGFLDDLMAGFKEGAKPLKTAYQVAKIVGKVYKRALTGKGACCGTPEDAECLCGGDIRSKFKAQLQKAGIDPKEYLEIARKTAERNGYDGRALEFSDNDIHKLMIYDDEGKVRRFGRVGYGDFIIWSHVNPEIAPKKRDTFRKSHSKIKGDWKKDKFSPNNLAINILW